MLPVYLLEDLQSKSKIIKINLNYASLVLFILERFVESKLVSEALREPLR